MKEIYGVRLNRVCEELQKMGLSQMIVSDPLSIWYLTGVWVQPYERLYALYVRTDGKHCFFLNNLFVIPEVDLDKIWMSDTDDCTGIVASHIAAYGEKEPIGIDKSWSAGFLLGLMERNPEAKWGLLYDLDKDVTKPFVLMPDESYHCNYFKTLIFHKGPLASIITKEAFDAVGGFSGKQHLGDYEMWHVLGRKFPVLMIPIGIVWWRTHEGQQMADNRSDPFVPFKYLILRIELINHPECPLPIEERQIVIKRTNKQMARLIVKTILHRNISKAMM